MDKKKSNKIFSLLQKTYPNAMTALKYKNALQLLVATILSAQCTDKRVNIVTATLFYKYKTPKDYAQANIETFENEIRSTGFYRNKAKNIISANKLICSQYNEKVPDTMKELISLPGVARKTANIVLYHAYGKIEGIAVDTHVRRVSGRVGLTENTDPVKIEQDLMKLFDKNKWGKLTNIFIEHGRNLCDARKPLCSKCPVRKFCKEGLSWGGK